MAERDINGTHSNPASDADSETRIAIKPWSGNQSAAARTGNPTEGEALTDEVSTRLAGNTSFPKPAATHPPEQSVVRSEGAATRLIEPGTGNHETSRQPQPAGIGTTLKNRFILEEVIARGGMGVVYKARDLRMEEFRDREPYVAVKVLGDECKTNPDFFMALQRESRKAQKLAHPNIVTAYDFDCDGDMVFMTMEYLVGQTLDTFIRDNQPNALDIKTAFSIIREMGQGLAYAHKNGIVHCDFKPGNVFLTREGTVKILDFGISRAAKQPDKPPRDATVFDAGKFGALTPPYASCEMLEGDDPDPRDDIYALACVTYELLTGSHPFNRKKATVARSKHMKPARIKGLSKQQWKGLLHGLAFERSSRTPDVDHFLSEFAGENQFLGLSRNWQIIAGLVFITLVSGALLLPYLTSSDYPLAGGKDTESQQPVEPVSLTQEQNDKISRLLEAAEVHLMIGYITEPPGSNAYEAYKQVLNINPYELRAKAGLVEIADHYEKLARESQAAGDSEKTRALTMAGLEVQPHHPGLLELNETTSSDTGWLRKVIRSVADIF